MIQIRSVKAFGLILFFFSFFSVTTFAQAKGYLGGVAGLSVPDADDSSSRPLWGVEGGARLDGEFGLGGFFFGSNKKESVANQDFDFNYSVYGLSGSFHFEGVADGAYLEARVGLAKVKAGENDYSPLAYGLGFGYDHFLGEAFSLGVQTGFMRIEGATKSDSTNLQGFTMLNFGVAGKFWF